MIRSAVRSGSSLRVHCTHRWTTPSLTHSHTHSHTHTRSLSSLLPSPEYLTAFSESMSDRDSFWAKAAEGIDWIHTPSLVHDCTTRPAPFDQWFSDGVMNTCFNCVDRHVHSGKGDLPAIIYDSPVSVAQEIISYSALQEKVMRVSGALAQCGVQKGDVVVIYMPMIPEAQVAMLACARLGAVHCVGKTFE